MIRTLACSRPALGALGAAAAFTLGACTTNPGSTTTTTGRLVPDDTVSHLSASNTDADWITLVLGTPTAKQRDTSSGRETWRWDYATSSRKHEVGAKTQTYHRSVHAEFDGSALVRAWTTESRSSE